MSAHQLGESSENFGGLVEAAVFGQSLKQVLGERVDLASLGQEGLNTFKLGLGSDGGVDQEVLDSLVLGHGSLKALQIAFNGIESVLTNSGGVEGGSVATIQTVKSDWGLHVQCQ